MAEFDKDYLDQLAKSLQSDGATKTTVQKRPTVIRNAGKRVLGGALKVIDYIERPYNALMNLGLDIAGGPEGLHPVRSLKRGLTGEDKTNFGDITKEVGWKPDTTSGKIIKGGVDFVGGVLLDPATYVSAGASKGATFLGRGVKALSKEGTQVLEKQLAKQIGMKVTSKGFKRAAQTADNDLYRKAVKSTLEIVEKNPEKYFATTKLKFAGKEIADLTAVATGVKKAFKPILDIPLVKRGPLRVGRRIKEVAGDVFIPRYSLMKSRNLTMSQKFDLTNKAMTERIARDTARDTRVTQAIQTFKGYSKAERQTITAELEKFLRTPELDADGNIRKFVQNNRSLTEIKDKKIREKVGELKEAFKEMWEMEVKAKLRDKKSVVEEGYVKRIAKGFRAPTRGSASSLMGRNEAVPTITESIKKFKAGEQAWRFEDDVAKILVERSTESDALFARKEVLGWLEGNKYMRKLKKGETSFDIKKAGLEMVQTRDGAFAVLPEIAKEFNLVKKAMGPAGFKEMLRLYDEVLDFWKLSVTSIWPSFHSRNAISNVFLDFLGGVKKPERFKQATEIQMYGRKLRQGAKPVDKTLNIEGKSWKISELYELAANHDVLGNGWVGGDFIKKAFIKPKGIKEKIRNPLETINWMTGKARAGGTAVENNARVALFIDQLAKGKTAQEAAMHTKKFLFDYQDLTEVERKVFKRVLPFYCVPDHAEILTKDGWKNYYSLDIKNDYVLTYNVGKSLAEWQKAKDKKIFYHNQELYSLGGSRGKILFTNEHRWVLNNNKIKKGFELNTSDRILMIPDKIKFSKASLLTEDEASLLGWLITDGYWRFRGEHCEAMIYQSPKKFLSIVKKVAGGNPRKPHPDTGVVCVPVKKSRLKNIEKYLKNNNFSSIPSKLSKKSLEALYEAMYLADGTVALKRGNRDTEFFASEKKEVLDTFVIASFLLGNRTREGKRGTYISKRKIMKVAGALSKEHYEGMVWCPLTKNGTWVMRQNGIITITGNTWMRKNIPLQLEQMAKQPGKYTGFIHAQEGIEGMSPDIEEKLLPKWMRTEEMFVKLPGGKMWRPDMPFQDLANIFSLKKFVSASSPLIKGVFEITANKDTFTGRPLADEKLPESKFQREKLKNWLKKQMRTTSFWKRASKEDQTSFEWWADFIFGQRTYPFDKAQGRKQFLREQKGQRKALLRFKKTQKKQKKKAKEAAKTILFMK